MNLLYDTFDLPESIVTYPQLRYLFMVLPLGW